MRDCGRSQCDNVFSDYVVNTNDRIWFSLRPRTIVKRVKQDQLLDSISMAVVWIGQSLFVVINCDVRSSVA